MFFIFLSWLYIGFSCANIGLYWDKIIKTESHKTIITIFNGLFVITLFACFWAIFESINIEFHLVLLFLNTLIYIINHKNFNYQINQWCVAFRKISFFLKFYLATIFLLILAQCSTAPFIIDNESYYIQTIKWVNEYGFVKGLGNLHLFLAQTSGWHIAQSVFNFSFIYKKFNDLSGFCLLLGNIFSVFKINAYFKTNNKNVLIFGLLPIFNLFLFQFINAPSPDLAIYIITIVLFSYYIENFQNCNSHHFKTIYFLILFILFIKPLSIGLFFLPFFIILNNVSLLKKNLIFVFTTSAILLTLIIVKNSILTGYPIYPLTLIDPKWDFAIPKNIVGYFFSNEMRMSFFINKNEYNNLSIIQIAIKWFFNSKIDTFFNILSLLLIIICPIFIFKKYNYKSFWVLLTTVFFQLILTIIVSPQYRFFIHYAFFLCLAIIASFSINHIKIKIIYILSLLSLLLTVFISINYKSITNNKMLETSSSFSKNNIIYPHHNSKFEMQFKKQKIGNLIYYSPENSVFFWGAGNGELPCVNSNQIEYFRNKFHCIPQLKSNNLKDGFYAKNISPNE